MNNARTRWTLELHPGHFAVLNEANPQPLVYPRQELAGKINFMRGLRVLSLRSPQAINFRMTGDAVAAFSRWLGPATPEELAAALKGLRSWWRPLLLCGVVLALFTGRQEDGLYTFATNPAVLFLAVWSFVVWACARFRPHPVVFLLDAVWWVVMSAALFWRAYHGGPWIWAVVAVFDLLIAWGARHKYINFSRK